MLNWGDDPPLIMCLLGSSRFQTDIQKAARAFTLAGHIVVAPCVYPSMDGLTLSDETKRTLDALQLRRIEMADAVYVVNPSGYLDSTTRLAIEHAVSLGKSVRYLEER